MGKAFFVGNDLLVRQSILMYCAFLDMIHDRDIGTFCGDTNDNLLRTKNFGLSLKILFSEHSTPPFYRDAQIGRYNIPSIDRSKLDWLVIKNACGGANGFMYGNYRYTLNCRDKHDGSLHQLSCHGNSPQEAEAQVMRFFALTHLEALTDSSTEEKKTLRSQTHSAKVKKAVRVHPIRCTVMSQAASKKLSARKTLDGPKKTADYSFPLWTKKAPLDFEAEIKKLMALGTN